jgi:catechol 2,3-dioxygenase-like lactoylglutathione lyase family enzyme
MEPSLNAVTLFTNDMAASVAFYELIGMECEFGGPESSFSSLRIGSGTYVNLQFDPGWNASEVHWGRFILWVEDVDAVHAALLAAGHLPLMAPADAPWGERYFHVKDPAGHEVSIARPLAAH